MLSFTLTAQQESPREKKNINANWKFELSDNSDYSKTEFDDANWRVLNLPHDWSIEGKIEKSNSGRNAWMPGGIAWYRKTVFVEKTAINKEIKIEFDGVYKNSSLWVNGHYVGSQHDGYTSFYFDITPFLNFGSENKIALKVDNSTIPNCRWYSGSGIYRNVWLTTTNKLAISQWGTFVTTPKITKELAKIAIETSIKNSDKAVKFDLETTVYNHADQKVAFVKSTRKIGNRTSNKVHQTLEVKNPELWSLEKPVLYTAKTLVKSNGKIIDQYETKFGIRTTQFHAKKGFFLNGENLKLKGVCLHHEAGVFGAAVPIEIWQRRLQKLKDMGCNAIRTAHNPTAPEFLDLCDEMGFLVMNEFVDKWNIDLSTIDIKKFQNSFFNPTSFFDPYFEYEWEKNYKGTIQRDRNHPSVIIWSVGNENHSPGTVEQIEGLKRYTSFVRSLDPTRPVISGMERGKDGVPSEKVEAIIETCKEMDLIALNYGEQWCKEIGKQNPGMPYVSTESYVYFNSTPEKRFANIERSPWLDVLDNEHNMGLFLWVGVDYLGESKTWPNLGTNCGLLDRGGFRKEISYLYEAFWSEKPMVRIAVYEGDADDFSKTGKWWFPAIKESWNRKEGEKVDLVTYTNCESVDLYLNGEKLGNKKLADFSNWIVKWKKISFKKGNLRAVGIIKGKEVCEFELNSVGKPHHIEVSQSDKNETQGIVQLEVSVVDRKGNLIYDDASLLNFELEGAAEIIAIDNGDTNYHGNFRNLKTSKTNKGKCLVVVKKKDNSDAIKVTIRSKGLKTKTIKL